MRGLHWLLVDLFILGHVGSDIVFNMFEYGTDYRSSGSPIQTIEPSSSLAEVCEGNSFMLQCPIGHKIRLGPEEDFQFGRNGDWEGNSECGRGQEVEHCHTLPARSQLLGRCNGEQTCGTHLMGMFPARDPCPVGSRDWNLTGPTSSIKPRKYLTLRFSCFPLASVSTERSKRNQEDEGSGEWGELRGAKTEELETQFFNHMENVTEITGEVKKIITDFLENAFNSLQTRNSFDDPAPPDSVFNLTEKVGSKLMNLLADEEELEVETSQVSLKLVKKKLSQDASTRWLTSDKSIELPDQEQLVQDHRDKLEITMASYNNLQQDLDSASDVITVSVNKGSGVKVNLSKPVTFLLPNNGGSNVSCAFWNFGQEDWSRDGCLTLCHNKSHTKCSCDHLTNFALIFNVHNEFVGDTGVHASQLQTITYVGFTISILCMVLTIIVFLFQNHQKTSDRDVIHVNLCASLLTAEIVFMFGINQTSDPTLCSFIAASLHYLFLSSFAWMFLEGFQIYIMLVRVFETSRSSQWKNFLIGYILPLLIVICSYVVDFLMTLEMESQDDMCFHPSQTSSYGTKDYCWLRVDNQFVLSFIIPAVIVIFSNIGFLTFAIHSMLVHKFKAPSKSNHDLIVSYMKGVGVLMCLLGSTWVTGLLYLAINSLFLAYAFTILNSLQGVGIFVFQCLLNPAIHSVLRRKYFFCLCSIGLSDSLGSYQRTGNTMEMTAKDSTSTNKRKSVESPTAKNDTQCL